MSFRSLSLSEKHVTRATETDTTQSKGEDTTQPDTTQFDTPPSGTGTILF